jgi:Ubiquitin family
LSLTVHLRGGPEDTRLGPTYVVEAEEEELVEGLKQRIFLESGIPPSVQLLMLRDNVLQDHLTLKQEELHGQEDIDMVNLDSLTDAFLSE